MTDRGGRQKRNFQRGRHVCVQCIKLLLTQAAETIGKRTMHISVFLPISSRTTLRHPLARSHWAGLFLCGNYYTLRNFTVSKNFYFFSSPQTWREDSSRSFISPFLDRGSSSRGNSLSQAWSLGREGEKGQNIDNQHGFHIRLEGE